ncbi:sensor histidine kinase [Sorangium sp. So ce1000]|uniref:PAS domain-containing sensor histidine kinase n=1 Tax=Sorangium sp. So ce1000 TaxID=3133325 RepID=UPI003F6348FB
MTGFCQAAAGRRLCLGSAALGFAGLVGWLADATHLTTMVPDQAPMMPNTALALSLIGVAGALRYRQGTRSRRLLKVLSLLALVVVLIIGVGTLAEYLFAIDLHIDSLLMPGRALPVGSQAGPTPGRSSPPTALSIALLAAALLLSDVRPTARARPSEWLTLLAGLIALTALVAFVFGAGPLYRSVYSPVIGVAPATAVSLLLATAGLLLERPAAGIMRTATSEGAGGIMLRRLALPTIVVPVLLGVAVTRIFAAVGIVELSNSVAALIAAGLLLLVITAVSLNRVHEALEASRVRTRDLIEQAPDGIFVANLDARYTDVNSAGCRLLGYSREEIIGKTIFDLIPHEDAGRLLRSKKQLVNGSVEIDEWRLKQKDGSYVLVEVCAKVLPDGRWQAFVRDISERKRIEGLLHASHADLNRAQSVAKVGSWRLDVRRNELRWSDENYRIFGVPTGTPMTYEGFLACVHPDDRAYVDGRWMAALCGEPYDIEHRVVAEGEIKWVREKADLEFDEHHTLLGGIGITQDITERKRLEEELRFSEAKYSGIVSISTDAIISIDDGQRITMFNEGAAAIFGYSKEEVIGAPLDILIPERFRARHRPHVERFAAEETAARSKDTRGREIVGLRKNGEEFPVDATISRIDVGGKRIFTVTLRDITEQTRARNQIRQSQERFELALKGADLAAWDWNIHTGEVIVNPRWCEMRGFRPDEVRPHVDSWLSGVHPDDVPRVQEALKGHFEGLTPEYEIELRVRTKSGRWIWILDRGKVFVRDGAGRPVRMVGTELDITERRRLEDEQKLLAEVGAVFASTLDYNDTLGNIARLVVRDLADFCIVDVIEEDAEVRRLKVVGRDPSKAWACELLERMPLDRRRPHLVLPALETQQPILIERLSPEMVESFAQSAEHLQVLRCMDPQSVMTVPLLAHGRLLGAIAFVSSTQTRVYGSSELQLAENLARRAALSVENARLYRAAERAIHARDDVLGIVAHDLRNPLGTMLMQAALLRHLSPQADGPCRKAAERIERAGTRMNRLIQDLLDVTRMEAGRLCIEQKAEPVGQLVTDAVEAQKPLAASVPVELMLRVDPDLHEVWADRDRLLQVFENLIGNAIKFTRPGGSISVGAASREGGVLCWVADTGAGIHEEDLPHVFDRFWQARKAGRRGAGLGLPIVKGIVEAHGGRIWVESALGRGSTFFFTIPEAARPPCHPAGEVQLHRGPNPTLLLERR